MAADLGGGDRDRQHLPAAAVVPGELELAPGLHDRRVRQPGHERALAIDAAQLRRQHLALGQPQRERRPRFERDLFVGIHLRAYRRSAPAG